MMDSLEHAIRQSETRARVAAKVEEENVFLRPSTLFDPKPPWQLASTTSPSQPLITVPIPLQTNAEAGIDLPTIKQPRYQREGDNRPTVPAPERETLAAPETAKTAKSTSPAKTKTKAKKKSAFTWFILACMAIFAMCLVVDRQARHTVFTTAKLSYAKASAAIR